MFLDRLIARTLSETAGLTPRRASRFEGEEGGHESRVEEMAVMPPKERASPAVEVAASHHSRAANAADRVPPVQVASSLRREPDVGPEVLTVREIRSIEQRLQAITPRAEPSTILAPVPVAHVESSPVLPSHPVEPSSPVERVLPAATHEVRVEHHSIERRLETLVRERTSDHVVETRVEASVANGNAPAAARAAMAPITPARPAPPMSSAVSRRRVASAPVLAPAPPPEPVVQVTIGRVEVRAVQAPSARRGATPREPRLELGDYLKRREQR